MTHLGLKSPLAVLRLSDPKGVRFERLQPLSLVRDWGIIFSCISAQVVLKQFRVYVVCSATYILPIPVLRNDLEALPPQVTEALLNSVL